MNAIRPVAVKLDQDTRDRLTPLANAKDRPTHWMLREAVSQFVEREENRDDPLSFAVHLPDGQLYQS